MVNRGKQYLAITGAGNGGRIFIMAGSCRVSFLNPARGLNNDTGQFIHAV